jgi:hypothetical protein
MKKIRSIAKKKGGCVISQRYYQDYLPMTFRCAQDHLFSQRPSKLEKKWCPRCLHHSKATALEELIQKKGGRVFSHHKHDYTLVCHQQHLFTLTRKQLYKDAWCPDCEREAAEIYVQLRGGRCHHIRNDIFMIWCQRDHLFELTLKEMKHQEWCPVCL